DDRYLFLEALISARNNLYLSYQGRDIHKNSERQPSLILKELMNYLEKCYGWKLLGETKEEKSQLKEEALHPFSQSCYSGNYASFDPSWMRMVQKGQLRNNLLQLAPMDFNDKSISLEQLVRFFDNPLKEFSLARLNLKFENYEEQLEDAEPFVVDGLTDYQIRDEFCESLLIEELGDSANTRLSYELSGHLPESPLTVDSLDAWQEDAEIFSQSILNKGQIVTKQVSVDIAGIQIEAELNWLVQGKQLLLWRPASRKAKDDMRLWLSHLVAIVIADSSIETQGLFFNKKEKKVENIVLAEGIASREAMILLEQLIAIWKQGLCQPALIHARLGKALLEKNKNINDFEQLSEDPKQDAFWKKVIQSGYNTPGLDVEAYFQWFYPHPPELTLDIHQRLFDTYHALYQQLMEKQ
ncbi:MAG: exodeoxyribonuclease V subunit gamma, partial [Thiotrichaceae bacterium]|nr:exodeoxyribonuclease V subunit gamma [Thiotrichaceae bacterium]